MSCPSCGGSLARYCDTTQNGMVFWMSCPSCKWNRDGRETGTFPTAELAERSA